MIPESGSGAAQLTPSHCHPFGEQTQDATSVPSQTDSLQLTPIAGQEPPWATSVGAGHGTVASGKKADASGSGPPQLVPLHSQAPPVHVHGKRTPQTAWLHCIPGVEHVPPVTGGSGQPGMEPGASGVETEASKPPVTSRVLPPQPANGTRRASEARVSAKTLMAGTYLRREDSPVSPGGACSPRPTSSGVSSSYG